MYFKHQLRTKWNLGLQRAIDSGEPGSSCAESVRVALKGIYKALDHGEYLTWDKKKKKINGDHTKLQAAVGFTPEQQRIVQNMFFKTGQIPGTQEVRRKINRVVLWACVNYGHAVFCTLSPSERQNHLACRLSRYRRCDPYAACDPTKRWCGADSPSLEPNADHIFDVHIPGFDARRILLAADPLAAVNAFSIQIRTVLATMLGVRMCPYCPHCNSDSTRPC